MTMEAAFVLTERSVPITVGPVDDDRTPEGMVCLGTTIAGRMVARCVVPPETADFVLGRGLFADPVPLALAARLADPGLQCRLFAVVPLPSDALADPAEEEQSPWSSSVPSWRPEAEAEETRQAAVLLGHVVRFTRDRKHPGDLPREAADVLATIVGGQVTEVVDKLLEDLLGS
jgi:hypothetical protein